MYLIMYLVKKITEVYFVMKNYSEEPGEENISILPLDKDYNIVLRE